ncbi:EAL domain-containing protein [Aureimonas frigidaquae]|uniref:Possible signaling protein with EAL, GGDEF domains n=1 Tax=Aureimonas frigidaquae TaxID=424757 RepID=A0A0P0Z4C8_9HYPH|nr:EAL domain-containing protein [Aureimonas frigidaquae]BAT28707.1 possible signaling protein with EAL, GGDEF domains [Aureimonas frigidaquae]
MIVALMHLGRDHAAPLVIAALIVCVVTAWLLLALMDHGSTAAGGWRHRWLVLAALVGGIGVWATHFVATLGFRPDFAFGFDPQLTALSAGVGIVAIGAPAAASVLTRRRGLKLLAGFAAGCGIMLMHVMGVSALTNCLVTQDASALLAMTILGAVPFAAALGLVGERQRAAAVALIVLAVCVVHFGAVASSHFEFRHTLLVGVGQETLGLMTGLAVSGLLLAGAATLRNSAKLEEQRHQKGLITTALTNMSNGLILIGPDGRIALFNDRLLQIFGITADAIVIGMRWQRFLANLGPHLGWSEQRLKRVIANHAEWFSRTQTTYLEHNLNDGRVMSVACRPIATGGAVLTYDDVTAERQAQKEVERLAFQDPLTGLPNRRSFHHALDTIYSDGAQATLLLIDLDRFKSVNDTLGHGAGDRILQQVAGRLRAVCQRGELVARLAGDEFAVIIGGQPPAWADDLAETIISTLGRTFSISNHSISIGCTIGVASTQDAGDGASLVQNCDISLYRAKAQGRGRAQRYEHGMREAAVLRGQLESELRSAIGSDALSLVYQPLYRLSDGALFGFEALIRWHHPVRGPISPSEFIPIAEKSGLIRDVGLWVLRTACSEASRWPPGIHVSVNVSPVQFRQQGFPQAVKAVLRMAGLDPARLEVELTETALVEDIEAIRCGLEDLRQDGIRVAMDDFGTGYSSLAHLRSFSLDRIKIDRTFVQAAPQDKGAAVVLSAVVQMAVGLNVPTIGEGVETLEQLALLATSGCHGVQGNLLGRPVTAAQAETLTLAPYGALALIEAALRPDGRVGAEP